MHILYMLAIGLVVGVIAKALVPGRDPGGLVITILLGMGGSLLAGSLGWYSGGQTPYLLASIVGAIGLLFTFRALTARGAEI
jgi:uncharacterized membrane protein YeaQ/YmgE (transglycosylase-associated protein family)